MLDGSYNAQNPPNYAIQTTCTSIIPTTTSTLIITSSKPQNFGQDFKQDGKRNPSFYPVLKEDKHDNAIQLDSLSFNTTSHTHTQDVDHVPTSTNISLLGNDTHKAIQYPKMISIDDVLTCNPQFDFLMGR